MARESIELTKAEFRQFRDLLNTIVDNYIHSVEILWDDFGTPYIDARVVAQPLPETERKGE